MEGHEELRIASGVEQRPGSRLRRMDPHGRRFDGIVGRSPALNHVLRQVEVVASTDSTVLIMGETGTGKELIARAIHGSSRRSGRPFVGLNCAALPTSLISSELFGHERGAFTGASERRVGRFERAHTGTLFLDEVGELSAEAQVALLRVLQEREFERVGGTHSIEVDVRVIAATNRSFRTEIENGKFRSDLFYRLNVFPIELPALRERKDDIPMLVEHFVQLYASRTGKTIQSIDDRTVEHFLSYDWPGNIRELQNVIERSVILTRGHVLSVDEKWFDPNRLSLSADTDSPHCPKSLRDQERSIIEAALAESRGRVSGPSGAAVKLAIPPSTLEHRIRTLNISKIQFRYRN